MPIVLCTYLGYRADVWLKTEPWLLVVGCLLGITLSFYGFFRRVLGAGSRPDRGGR